jgi:hypothetical protein
VTTFAFDDSMIDEVEHLIKPILPDVITLPTHDGLFAIYISTVPFNYEGPTRLNLEKLARLIAAAPDLLKSAIAAWHALQSYRFGNASPDLALEVLDSLHAAIEKAGERLPGVAS